MLLFCKLVHIFSIEGIFLLAIFTLFCRRSIFNVTSAGFEDWFQIEKESNSFKVRDEKVFINNNFGKIMAYFKFNYENWQLLAIIIQKSVVFLMFISCM